MAVKSFVFVNENQFTWRSGQNYTLSYYQLTFSEPNRLIVSVICAWLSDKSNFSNYKIVKNSSSVKQNDWTTSCTQNETGRAWETLIWLESVTEKVTGNAQTGACVDVLPRCWLKPEFSWTSINCFHGFLTCSDREGSLVAKLRAKTYQNNFEWRSTAFLIYLFD